MIHPVNGPNYNALESDSRNITFTRASDLMLCEKCEEPLWKHRQPLKDMCPTMLEDCFGRWWKS